MERFSKYGFQLAAISSFAMLFYSCGTTQKTVAPNKVSIIHKELTRDDRDEVMADYYEASKQRILGNYDRAIEVFKQCLKIQPDNAAANFQIADIYEFYKKPDS